MKQAIESGLDFEDAVNAAKGDLKELEKEASDLSKSMGKAFEQNFTNTLMKGLEDGKMSFSSFANSLLNDIARIIIQQQVAQMTAGLMTGLPFAKGGVPGTRLAQGGVVNSPTKMRFAQGGTGLVGERNKAEGVLPLKRMANGDLGVQSGNGGSGVVLNIENNTGMPISGDMISQGGNDEQKTINIVLNGINKNTSGIRDMIKGMR